jgi:hypothetical protein
MSALPEIEAAVEKLTPDDLRKFAAWLDARQALLNNSETLLRT